MYFSLGSYRCPLQESSASFAAESPPWMVSWMSYSCCSPPLHRVSCMWATQLMRRPQSHCLPKASSPALAACLHTYSGKTTLSLTPHCSHKTWHSFIPPILPAVGAVRIWVRGELGYRVDEHSILLDPWKEMYCTSSNHTSDSPSAVNLHPGYRSLSRKPEI